MGGFLPTAALGILQLGIEASQRSKQAQAAQAANEHQARAQILQVRREQELKETERRRELEKALAAQRARFGSRGLDMSGSSEAVLRGLSGEADAQTRNDQDLARLQINDIKTRSAISTRRNLLQASQPNYRSALGILQRSLTQKSLLGR